MRWVEWPVIETVASNHWYMLAKLFASWSKPAGSPISTFGSGLQKAFADVGR